MEISPKVSIYPKKVLAKQKGFKSSSDEERAFERNNSKEFANLVGSFAKRSSRTIPGVISGIHHIIRSVWLEIWTGKHMPEKLQLPLFLLLFSIDLDNVIVLT